jgi:hypothetical protein
VRGKSGGGPPHSKTLARCRCLVNSAKRLGVRQSSGALETVTKNLKKNMSEQFKNKKGWRILRRLLITSAILATLMAVFYAEEDWRGKRAWENCKRELEAKGAVLDWNKYIPPPIPDDQNFYTASTNILLRFVNQNVLRMDASAQPLWLQWLQLASNSFPVLDFAKSKPAVVAELTAAVISPGTPMVAQNTQVIQLRDPAASRQLQDLLLKTVGRSANGTRGFHFSELQLSNLAPVKIVLQTDRLLTKDDFKNLVPSDLMTNIGSLAVEPTTVPGMFQVRFVDGKITSAADYLKWSDQFVPDFDEIREALKRPYAIIPGDYSQPYAMPIPSLVTMRMLAQTLAQRTQCFLLLNRPEAALAELTLMHDVCRILEKPPTGQPMTLVEAMINVAITGLYVSTVHEGFRLHGWQEPQMAAIQAQLEGLNLLPYVTDAFRMEQSAAINCGERINFRKLMSGESFGYGPKTFWLKTRSHVYDLMPRGWVYQNILFSAELMQKQIDRFDPANVVIFPKKWNQSNDEMSAAFDHFNLFHLLASIATPNFGKALQTLAFNQTLANQAQIACALERYHLAHGDYPESLAALVPQFIEKLPHDIIGGQPLPYRRTDDGKFLLYSVGWNETDDGGVTARDKSGNEDRTKGDWGWQYPAK